MKYIQLLIGITYISEAGDFFTGLFLFKVYLNQGALWIL